VVGRPPVAPLPRAAGEPNSSGAAACAGRSGEAAL